MKKTLLKTIIVCGILVLIYGFYSSPYAGYLTFEGLKAHQNEFNVFYGAHPLQTALAYLALYIIATALSFPGAAVLTLAGGAIFGFWWGTVIVSVASTLGATAAFLLSRFFLRDFVQKKYGQQLRAVNQGFEKEGAYYLFTLRLAPLFPFFFVNLVMGLTPISTLTYFWVSQIGMLPGTAAYVNAGTQLSHINSAKGLLSFELVASFAVLGILPLLSKWALEYFRRPRHLQYNLIVIGGGAAGLVTSYIAAAVKAKVALIEGREMGGDCLNTGCVPSKAFIGSAKVLSYLRRSETFGLGACEVKNFNFALVMERVQRVIAKIQPHDSTERYKALGVDCIDGWARIHSPHEVHVNGQKLTTKAIVIATGAQPLLPAIDGLQDMQPYTSETIWSLRTLPRRLLILGGGAIGCELAQAFARMGSQVTLVEMAPTILGREDEDVALFAHHKLTGEGVHILTGHKAEKFSLQGESKVATCVGNQQKINVEFDQVLVALGRKANTKGFGLEELGITIADGAIDHDEFLRTNHPNIYVCGDVAGPYQFTHVAAHQAWYAAVNALLAPFKKFKVDYRVIPRCTFTDPEIARVGLNEVDAKAQGIAYELTKYSLNDLDRAIIEDEDHGFIKILTVPGKDKILGVTIVAARAGDLIAEYVTAMKHGLGLNALLSTIHVYPTFAEANKSAAGLWKKNNAPARALEVLKKFHQWRRS